MVLAPGIFVAFAVVVEEGLSVGAERHILHRERRIELRTCAGSGDVEAVDLGELSRGKLHVVLVGLQSRGEEDRGGVDKRHGPLGGGVGGELAGFASAHRHGIEIEVASAVGSKDYGLAVGAPYGLGVIRVVGGELSGAASLGGYGVDIAFVGECDL